MNTNRHGLGFLLIKGYNYMGERNKYFHIMDKWEEKYGEKKYNN